MRISVWSSDVCSSDLRLRRDPLPFHGAAHPLQRQPFMGGVLVDDDEAFLRLRDDIGAGDLAPGDAQREADRASVVQGKSASVRVVLGGRCTIKNNNQHSTVLSERGYFHPIS